MRNFEDMWVGERAAEHAKIDSGRASGEGMKERGRLNSRGKGLLNLFATCEHERVGWLCVTEGGSFELDLLEIGKETEREFVMRGEPIQGNYCCNDHLRAPIFRWRVRYLLAVANR